MDNPFALYNEKSSPRIYRKHSFVLEDLMLGKRSEQKFFVLKQSQIRLGVLFILFFLSITIIFAQLLFLQIFYGTYYRSIAEGNRIRIHRLGAQRGLIYDRNETILADNTHNFLLVIVPVDFPKDRRKRVELVSRLLPFTQKSYGEIMEMIEGADDYSYQPIVIEENLSYGQALQVRLLTMEYSGIRLDIGSRRVYYNSEVMSLSHILGYMGKINEEELKKYPDIYVLNDSLGKSGIEYQYEVILRGQAGREKVEVDALGRKKETLAYLKARPGNNLILSIDIQIQKKLEAILKKYLGLNRKRRAAVILLDPNNGQVLSLISWPSYNNNIFSEGISPKDFASLLEDPDRPLFPRSIQGTYPSGSTIKPVLAAAALQEGLITPRTTFLSSGGIQINKWFFPDWKAGGHGLTDLRKALAESVNTYFYIIGGGYKNFPGLGIEKIYAHYRKAGLGQPLGIDLPGESSGLVPTPEWKAEKKGERWYIGDTYHVSIGQGDILVTPLQVASWTAMIGNGGKLYQPSVVLADVDSLTQKRENQNPVILENSFTQSQYLAAVKQGLRDAVVYGSAHGLSDLPIQVAGKTGTAQWSEKNEYHSWFTSFAPYPDPEIVLTILIEEGGEGSRTAVPLAHEFFLWWTQYQQRQGDSLKSQD